MYLLDEANLENFCETTKGLWEIVGILLTVIKIVIPIVLVVLGSIDLLKAVTSDDKDMIKKQSIVLGKRAVAAIIIFFIPTIVWGILSAVSTVNEGIKKGQACWEAATGIKGTSQTNPPASS